MIPLLFARIVALSFCACCNAGSAQCLSVTGAGSPIDMRDVHAHPCNARAHSERGLMIMLWLLKVWTFGRLPPARQTNRQTEDCDEVLIVALES